MNDPNQINVLPNNSENSNTNLFETCPLPDFTNNLNPQLNVQQQNLPTSPLNANLHLQNMDNNMQDQGIPNNPIDQMFAQVIKAFDLKLKIVIYYQSLQHVK